MAVLAVRRAYQNRARWAITSVARFLISLPPRRVVVAARGCRDFHHGLLSVSEVDVRGENLPMLLHSLPHEKRVDFEQFVSRYIGVRAVSVTQGGHTEIRLHEGTAGRGFNLVDSGFGYSQVLPFAAQVWSMLTNTALKKGRAASLLALEQPELHLHPALQARIADMLVRVASGDNRKRAAPLAVVAETHSETIINRIGAHIRKGAMHPDNVAIYVFERDGELSKVSRARFDDDGSLIDWPYGFFLPDDL